MTAPAINPNVKVQGVGRGSVTNTPGFQRQRDLRKVTGNFVRLTSRTVQRICPECQTTYSYAILDATSRVLCNNCGKMVRLEVGELSEEDLRTIEYIQQQVRENPDYIDYLYDEGLEGEFFRDVDR